MKHIFTRTSLAAALLIAGPAVSMAAAPQDSQGTVSATAALAEGEVRRVDKEAKKITLRHGPIPNLDMPPMTMVFQVKDPAMVEQVKAGDKVRFSADKVNGAYVVTAIEAVN